MGKKWVLIGFSGSVFVWLMRGNWLNEEYSVILFCLFFSFWFSFDFKYENLWGEKNVDFFSFDFPDLEFEKKMKFQPNRMILVILILFFLLKNSGANSSDTDRAVVVVMVFLKISLSFLSLKKNEEKNLIEIKDFFFFWNPESQIK